MLKFGLIIAIPCLLITGGCANIKQDQMQSELIRDCIDNGGSWDEEHKFCNTQSAILSPKRNDPPPWVEGRKKQN